MLGNETKWCNISKHKYFKNLHYTEDSDFTESNS